MVVGMSEIPTTLSFRAMRVPPSTTPFAPITPAMKPNSIKRSNLGDLEDQEVAYDTSRGTRMLSQSQIHNFRSKEPKDKLNGICDSHPPRKIHSSSTTSSKKSTCRKIRKTMSPKLEDCLIHPTNPFRSVGLWQISSVIACHPVSTKDI